MTGQERDEKVDDMREMNEVTEVLSRAQASAPEVAVSSNAERARWLNALAEGLEVNIDALVAVALRETHLGEPRLRGEVARTANQLRLFSDVITEGSYVEAILDSPDPVAPIARADLRRMLRPLGPVAVFGASNFPFAFSVLGGDTASALAAGCPVVVKAHPGHPETSNLTAAVAAGALAQANAPAGLFGMVHGFDAGTALVQAPAITAVGFTGSVRGGRALFDLASARPAPIPFYGELGSLNPVVLTHSAIDEHLDEIVAGFVQSFSNDGGQLCTKPGMVFVPRDTGFEEALRSAVADRPAQTLLTHAIAQAFIDGAHRMAHVESVQVIAGQLSDEVASASPLVLGVSAAALASNAETLLEECFGPFSLVVRYDTLDELNHALGSVPGSLTASVHHGKDEDVTEITRIAAGIAGRVIFNGWPTGVAVGWAQHHGGSWPATTASLHTSVGASAIRRWLTPIAYQNAPEAVLPPALRSANPLGIPRRVNGVLTV